MNKRSWFIPVLILAINALAIAIRWNSLQELIPAHFDLQGNAGGSMSRDTLIIYPLIGAAVCLVAYMIAHIRQRLQTGLIILTSGICLVLLLSTMVSLTSGKIPLFMLAEPVILLLAIAAPIVSLIRSRRNNSV